MKPPSRIRRFIHVPGRSAFLYTAGWKKMFSCWSSNAFRSRKKYCSAVFARRQQNEGSLYDAFLIEISFANCDRSVVIRICRGSGAEKGNGSGQEVRGPKNAVG